MGAVRSGACTWIHETGMEAEDMPSMHQGISLIISRESSGSTAATSVHLFRIGFSERGQFSRFMLGAVIRLWRSAVSGCMDSKPFLVDLEKTCTREGYNPQQLNSDPSSSTARTGRMSVK